MKLQQTYLSDFVSLLFPELCAACGESLVANEHLICTGCRFSLPLTNFHLHPDNIVSQQFWGKMKLESAYALYYFAKGGKIQNLMHTFKYKGVKQIGNLLGNIAGEQLVKNDVFKSLRLKQITWYAQRPPKLKPINRGSTGLIICRKYSP